MKECKRGHTVNLELTPRLIFLEFDVIKKNTFSVLSVFCGRHLTDGSVVTMEENESVLHF